MNLTRSNISWQKSMCSNCNKEQVNRTLLFHDIQVNCMPVIMHIVCSTVTTKRKKNIMLIFKIENCIRFVAALLSFLSNGQTSLFWLIHVWWCCCMVALFVILMPLPCFSVVLEFLRLVHCFNVHEAYNNVHLVTCKGRTRF